MMERLLRVLNRLGGLIETGSLFNLVPICFVLIGTILTLKAALDLITGGVRIKNSTGFRKPLFDRFFYFLKLITYIFWTGFALLFLFDIGVKNMEAENSLLFSAVWSLMALPMGLLAIFYTQKIYDGAVYLAKNTKKPWRLFYEVQLPQYELMFKRSKSSNIMVGVVFVIVASCLLISSLYKLPVLSVSLSHLMLRIENFLS